MSSNTVEILFYAIMDRSQISSFEEGSGSGDYEETSFQPETRDPSYYDTGSGDYDITDYDYSTTTQQSFKYSERCQYLNEVRANYTICCKYPGLVIEYEYCGLNFSLII